MAEDNKSEEITIGFAKKIYSDTLEPTIRYKLEKLFENILKNYGKAIGSEVTEREKTDQVWLKDFIGVVLHHKLSKVLKNLTPLKLAENAKKEVLEFFPSQFNDYAFQQSLNDVDLVRAYEIYSNIVGYCAGILHDVQIVNLLVGKYGDYIVNLPKNFKNISLEAVQCWSETIVKIKEIFILIPNQKSLKLSSENYNKLMNSKILVNTIMKYFDFCQALAAVV